MTTKVKQDLGLIDCNGRDLSKDEKAVVARKKPIPLKVDFAEKDGTIETKEGTQPYKAGDAIVTGTEGEQWPIPTDSFNKTYEVVDKDKGLYAKKSIDVYARKMGDPFTVNISWSNKPLVGKPGDWLVQYRADDFGIVDGGIFNKTYDIIRQNTSPSLRNKQEYI